MSPHPQPQSESASMLTALYCITMIHQLVQGRACTNTMFGQTLQSAVVYHEYKVNVIKI